jgi:hypothetical protein
MGMGVLSPQSGASAGTTIVGGQPDGQRRQPVQSVPVGLEQVLVVAARDPAFAAELLADRGGAVKRRGFVLVESERLILAAAPERQLAAMIARIDVSSANLERRGFMRAVAATLVTIAAGSTLQACGTGDGRDPGSRLDGPGDAPFRETPVSVPIPESPNMATEGGARPDLPEPSPPEPIAPAIEPEPSPAKPPRPPKAPVETTESMSGGGVRPDRPPTVDVKPTVHPTRGHTID